MYKQRKMTEYAVYKGENIICMGNAKECASHLGILEKSFRYYHSAAYKRKVDKRKRDYGNRLEIVELDDEEME